MSSSFKTGCDQPCQVELLRRFHDKKVSPVQWLRCPVQSAIFAAALFDGAPRKDDFFEFEESVISSITSKPLNSVSLPTASAITCDWSIADEIVSKDLCLENAPNCYLNNYPIYPASLGDGIEFSTDLHIAVSNMQSDCMNEKQLKKQSLRVTPTIPTLSADKSIGVVPKLNPNLPFQSAREKFESEVPFY